MSQPLLSVVMPVYNARPYLEEAVLSILSQTFEDFEFIIINDGSTDGTKEVLERFADRDDRVRLVHQENRGLVTSLNRGLDTARGSFVARMDGDDISHPERFERQVEFLHSHPEVGGVGTQIKYVDAGGRVTGTWPLPTDPGMVSWKLLFNSCLCHSSTMIRRALLNELGGYAEWAYLAEDYELWTRIVQVSRLANLPETLLKFRRHEGSVTVSRRPEQIRVCGDIAAEYHRALLGQGAKTQMAKFLVWMETEGVERAVAETGVHDFTAVHEYVRALYRAHRKHMVPINGNTSVRRAALPKLDTLSDRIKERYGYGSELLYKARARFMPPRYEVIPWVYRAALERLPIGLER